MVCRGTSKGSNFKTKFINSRILKKRIEPNTKKIKNCFEYKQSKLLG